MNCEQTQEEVEVEFPIVDLPEEYADDLESFVPILHGKHRACGGVLLNITKSKKNSPLKESDVADFVIRYKYQRKQKRQDGVYYFYNDEDAQPTECKASDYYKLSEASNHDDKEKFTKEEIKKLTSDAWDIFRKGGEKNAQEDIPYAMRNASNTKGQPVDLEENNKTLKMFKKKIGGVSDCDQYFGKPGTISSMHSEDMDAYSANYVFFGLKVWYFILAAYRLRYLKLVAGEYIIR
jgi:hypothetical protein